MLDADTVEKTIGLFSDPEIVKVCWPFKIIDGSGSLTGEHKFTHLPEGSFRQNALKVGPANHFTPAQSGNFWRRTFLDQVLPMPEADFRHCADSYLFTFAPFFGSFRTYPEPLTSYRVHGANISRTAGAKFRRDDWETRAIHLHAFLTAQGEDVTIEAWRRNSPYFRRLDGVLKAENKIGAYVPKDAPIVLIGNHLFQRADIRPLRAVHRPSDRLRSPERTERDFRRFLVEMQAADLHYLVCQGPAVSKNTNLSALTALLHSEHQVLYEDKWIVIASLPSQTPPS
jgi:hypothetical protein